jgi:glutamine amidotransferase
MIAIVDYGIGNLFSLKSSFNSIGADVTVTSDSETIRKADKIILPGVGAFEDAAIKLKESTLDSVIKEETANGKPLMGICLGMQLLFDKSYEYGIHEGLGLISGVIRPISDVIPKGYKIPHIGWNALHITKPSPILANTRENDYVYFVHSYYAAECDEATIATSEYGYPLTAAVQKENVYGCQFHPEKSGKVGLGILRAFCDL